MKSSTFDYTAAKKAGYSDEEISNHLREQHPTFDYEAAQKADYTLQEINEHLSSYKPKRTALEKAGRTATQYGLGLLSGTPAGITYEVGVAPLATKGFHTTQDLHRIGEDLEYLYEKNSGKSIEEWDSKDKELYDLLSHELQNPQEVYNRQTPIDLSIRGLAEKATGIDLHPEGLLEKAANWAGFIKDPKNIKNILSVGLNPKELTKAILPNLKESSRAIGAGVALELAEDGNFGPTGTIAAAIVGDLIGHAPKGIYNVVTNPKQSAAQALNFITRGNTKKQATAQLLEDFKDSGLKIDAGTLTGSPLIQMIQARLAQSGLIGEPLDNLRKELSNQIVSSYENILQNIGNLGFENNYQAAEAVKDALRVSEQKLNLPDTTKKGRSLEGRITLRQQTPEAELRLENQQNFLNRIAPQEFESDYQAGLNLKTAAEDIKAPVKEGLERRWTDFNERVGSVESGPQAQLAEQMQRFVREHTGSLLLGEATAEARVLRAAEGLLNALRTEGGLVGVSLNQLIKTKRTLADIANWEIGTSDFKSAYKKLAGDISEAIERTLSEANPELLEEYRALNADHAAFKDFFENDNVKHLFEPKNENYISLHNEFTSNPDKLIAAEDILSSTPRGQEVIAQAKRDYAQRIIQRPGATDRDVRNLSRVLGPENTENISEFIRQRDLIPPDRGPQAARGRPLGLIGPAPQTRPSVQVVGRTAKETPEHVRRKMYEYLTKKIKNAGEGQIMKEMSTIKGIRALKRALSLTPEGKQLFDQLSRYKIADIVDKKMMDSAGKIDLAKFSGILNSATNRAIIRELVGKEAYEQLRLLQKNSGRLAASAGKFLKAPERGITLTDVGLSSAAVTGVCTGNPWLAIPAIIKLGGSFVLAKLLADPVFLKALEKASTSESSKLFEKYLKEMKPRVDLAKSNAVEPQKHKNEKAK